MGNIDEQCRRRPGLPGGICGDSCMFIIFLILILLLLGGNI